MRIPMHDSVRRHLEVPPRASTEAEEPSGFHFAVTHVSGLSCTANPGLYLKIENAPYMALVIEATDESGPSGLPAISVARYGEQNGDLMRDPEMCRGLPYLCIQNESKLQLVKITFSAFLLPLSSISCSWGLTTAPFEGRIEGPVDGHRGAR